MRDRPLIVALYGGPGAGKSTTAAAVFAALKLRGVNAELVHEVAKSLTWEKRSLAPVTQPYIAGKQLHYYDRLNGQVDVIVTDTSTLLSLIFGPQDGRKAEMFKAWLLEDWAERDTLDVYLRRHRMFYEAAGRQQTETEALALDGQIYDVMDTYLADFLNLEVDEPETVSLIVEETLKCLQR